MTDTSILRAEYLRLKKELFDQYYDFLNDMQRQAVYTIRGPLLILAGAGSGKTTVLVNRIVHLIRYGDAVQSEAIPYAIDDSTLAEMHRAKDLPREELGEFLTRFAINPPKAWSVLAITFTNKAAREIKSRLASAFGEDVKGIWCCIFKLNLQIRFK